VRGALDDFYNSLSDEQKAVFNLIGRQPARQSGCRVAYRLNKVGSVRGRLFSWTGVYRHSGARQR
jgi:hypothetical protein